MAYNPRGKDKKENESTRAGPATYASIINLHPDRNKISGYGCDDTSQPSTTAATHQPTVLEAGAPNAWPSMQTRSSLALEHQAGQTAQTSGPAWRVTKKAPTEISVISNRASSSIAEQYEKLFGKLPDPIRLHEKTGEFDGQVTFIGHPNRDVSAHQWSLTSFQWVNLGRYAYARDRVEGSLASDCLNDYEAAKDPLMFFKHAAENRERSAKEAALSQETLTEVHQTASVDTIAAILQSQHITPSLRGEGQSTLKLPQGTSIFPPLDAYTHDQETATTTILGDYLEDPFVAAPQSAAFTSSGLKSRGNKIDSLGDLNFNYEFPYKSTVSEVPRFQRSGSSALPESSYDGSQKVDSTLLKKTILVNLPSQPNLLDFLAGEVAAKSTLEWKRPALASPPVFNVNNRLTHGLYDGDDKNASDYAWNRPARLSNQHYPEPNSFLQSYHGAPGFTVANPHRPVSTLNAAAPIYTGIRGGGLATVPLSSNRPTAGLGTTGTSLRFSDPDGQRYIQDYEVINGLSKQLPTPQNFRGPFFTDSKPTANDPTASLSIEIIEEDKLRNWFHDGHRAARQQEHAKILMNTVGPSTRGHTTGGVIGQRPSAREPTAIDKTPLFLRLHETLSEYAEESRSGQRDYWTRAWKTAPKEDGDAGRSVNANQHKKPSLR
ncbi:hypothetical protein IQ07DRAFT_638424 [Pyrenochaeta sp. DS3sAY3a]|nr:hypothetical protein IQ07DRAFT_638424 [Pyrenochaeta sp. DS3sAY3a]